MKAFVIVLCALFVAGCDLCAKDPIIQVKEVLVPVPVKCEVAYPVKPEEPFVTLELGAPLSRKVTASLKELENYRWYSKELEAALRECAKSIDATTTK